MNREDTMEAAIPTGGIGVDLLPLGPLFIWGVLLLLDRTHFLRHSELEFSAFSQDDGLVASPGFMSVIGGLFPIALWGLSSL